MRNCCCGCQSTRKLVAKSGTSYQQFIEAWAECQQSMQQIMTRKDGLMQTIVSNFCPFLQASWLAVAAGEQTRRQVYHQVYPVCGELVNEFCGTTQQYLFTFVSYLICRWYVVSWVVYYYWFDDKLNDRPIPSLPHSVIPGSKPSFYADPSHRSLPFLLQDWLHGFPRLFTDTSEHIRFFTI